MRRMPSAACALAALILVAAIEPRQGELRAAEATPFPIDFIENRGQWRSDVPAFAAVAFRNLYPGIDVRLHERARLTIVSQDCLVDAVRDRVVQQPSGRSQTPERRGAYLARRRLSPRGSGCRT